MRRPEQNYCVTHRVIGHAVCYESFRPILVRAEKFGENRPFLLAMAPMVQGTWGPDCNVLGEIAAVQFYNRCMIPTLADIWGGQRQHLGSTGGSIRLIQGTIYRTGIQHVMPVLLKRDRHG